MLNKLKYVAAFTAGAAVGAAVSWKLLKNKYGQIAQEEINNVKEHYRNKAEEAETDDDEDEPIDDDAPWDEPEEPKVTRELKAYVDAINDNEYYDHYIELDEVEAPTYERPISGEPYVITPEQFGDSFEHEMHSLTYYNDGILADDFDDVIYEIDDIIGEDSLNHFGEYEPDMLYVRNDARRSDYEILRDYRNYPGAN